MLEEQSVKADRPSTLKPVHSFDKLIVCSNPTGGFLSNIQVSLLCQLRCHHIYLLLLFLSCLFGSYQFYQFHQFHIVDMVHGQERVKPLILNLTGVILS